MTLKTLTGNGAGCQGASPTREPLRGEVCYSLAMHLNDRHDRRDVVPTGEITVRFREVPDDRQLQHFASGYGLRLLRRNDFVPQQAVFRPSDRTDLSSLVRTIEGDGSTKAVWLNTLSRYNRASS